MIPDEARVVCFLALKRDELTVKQSEGKSGSGQQSSAVFSRTRYHFTDEEVLRGRVGDEVDEHLLQPGRQAALELHLQAALLGRRLTAGATREEQSVLLVRHQVEQLVCNQRKTINTIRFLLTSNQLHILQHTRVHSIVLSL